MIIGKGDIASVLFDIDRVGMLYFASGVSNSLEDRESEYQREIKLLKKQNSQLHCVYFSTLSVFYKDSRYTRHKREMERLVKGYFYKYTIVRLGNIDWGKNPHTLINSFKNKQKKGEKLIIENVYRYMLDKEEFLHWVSLVPDWNCEMNITGKRMLVKDVVKKYVAQPIRFFGGLRR